MSFDTFSRQTSKRWERMARTLLRRWNCPASVAVEDVTQELLIGAYAAIPKWDSRKPQGISKYVVWQASTAAKYWIHKQRGAVLHGSKDCNPSRFDLVVAGEEGVDAEVLAAQETIVLALQRLRLVMSELKSVDRELLSAIALTGSVDGALELLGHGSRARALSTLRSAVRALEWQ